MRKRAARPIVPAARAGRNMAQQRHPCTGLADAAGRHIARLLGSHASPTTGVRTPSRDWRTMQFRRLLPAALLLSLTAACGTEGKDGPQPVKSQKIVAPAVLLAGH